MYQFLLQFFSIQVAVISFVYCCTFGGLYYLLYLGLSRRYQGQDLGKISFEMVSLIQFMLWIPLGFGLFKLNRVYLFLLPMIREIFDFILIFIIERNKFTAYYQRFILIHHINSNITRILLLVVGIYLFKDGLNAFLKVCLLYYCCSIFLVAPGALEKIIFNEEKSLKIAYFKVSNFLMARVSHFVVLLMVIFTIYSYVTAFYTLYFTILTLILALINEYQSISSGFPKVKNSFSIVQNNMLNLVLKIRSNTSR